MTQFTKMQDKRNLIQFHIAYRQVTRVQGIPHILPKILVRVSKKKSGILLFNLSKRSETIFLEKFDEETGTYLTMNLLPIRPKSIQHDGNIILRATELVFQLISVNTKRSIFQLNTAAESNNMTKASPSIPLQATWPTPETR